MKLLLSYALYHVGDAISLTFMRWGRGHGYSIYKQVMLWSVDLDPAGRIWKHVKPAARKARRDKSK
jgi:hypothetical protein